MLFVARMESGALATFEATRLSTGYKNANRVEIHGELGAIRFNFERMNELDWYDATLPDRESTTLFDIVAVYMAFSEDWVVYSIEEPAPGIRYFDLTFGVRCVDYANFH